MKFTIILTALAALSLAAPAPAPEPGLLPSMTDLLGGIGSTMDKLLPKLPGPEKVKPLIEAQEIESLARKLARKEDDLLKKYNVHHCSAAKAEKCELKCAYFGLNAKEGLMSEGCMSAKDTNKLAAIGRKIEALKLKLEARLAEAEKKGGKD